MKAGVMDVSHKYHFTSYVSNAMTGIQVGTFPYLCGAFLYFTLRTNVNRRKHNRTNLQKEIPCMHLSLWHFLFSSFLAMTKISFLTFTSI